MDQEVTGLTPGTRVILTITVALTITEEEVLPLPYERLDLGMAQMTT